MRTNVTVRVVDVLAALHPMAKQHGVQRLSDLGKKVADFKIDAAVNVEQIMNAAGLVDQDEARSEVIASLSANVRDLSDGLQALIDGDRAMAAVLLDRAFQDWPDARSLIDQVVMSRGVRDDRQMALMVA